MIFGLFPIPVVALMITTTLNVVLALNKNNRKRWINVVASIVGLFTIVYCSIYGI